jgi:DNA-binding transcriptional MerR regulator
MSGAYTAGEVAKLSGVSVRTLHHYDEIGLLAPSGRTAAGYRQYGDDDLTRLHHILCYRELGFDLRTIATMLDARGGSSVAHLRRQRELLVSRIGQMRRMVQTVEKMMEARKRGIDLTPEEMLEVFGDFDPTEHAVESEERWGDTDAYKESRKRTTKYTKEDWKRLGAEAEATTIALADALGRGVPAGSPEAMELAERARLHIDRWFYACSHEMHAALGDTYVGDERFAKHYEDRRPGLARYVRDAIAANAERAKGG